MSESDCSLLLLARKAVGDDVVTDVDARILSTGEVRLSVAFGTGAGSVAGVDAAMAKRISVSGPGTFELFVGWLVLIACEDMGLEVGAEIIGDR